MKHHQRALSDETSDTPVDFNFDTFALNVDTFVDGKVITKTVCSYVNNIAIVQVLFEEPCVKFSFQFCARFKKGLKSEKQILTSLQKVVYEIPCVSSGDGTLDDFVFSVLETEISRRLKGAYAELKVRDILDDDLAKTPPLRVLKSVEGYRISNTDADKRGIDIYLIVVTKRKHEFFPIDIKSYKGGLKEVKEDIAGLFVDSQMPNSIILHKISTLVEGFAEGEYLRI